MLDPNIWFNALLSLVFGFGLLAVSFFSLLVAALAYASVSTYEHPIISLLMARRRWVTLFVGLALTIDLLTVTWEVTRIASGVAAAIYTVCVYLVIPATRRTGKVTPIIR